MVGYILVDAFGLIYCIAGLFCGRKAEFVFCSDPWKCYPPNWPRICPEDCNSI